MTISLSFTVFSTIQCKFSGFRFEFQDLKANYKFTFNYTEFKHTI